MKPKFTKTRFSNSVKVLSIFMLMLCSFTSVTAQTNCDSFDQNLSFSSRIDDCGRNGVVNIAIVDGQAPFNFTIDDVNSSLTAATTTNSRSLNIGLPPGTYRTTIVDANGCESSKVFNIYARNFVVRQLDCNTNGLRQVQFANNSSSFLPVTVQIGSANFTLSRGTSTTFNVAAGTYTATVSRPGCAPYTVRFTVAACEAARSATTQQPIAKRTITIDEAATLTAIDVKLYPNPSVNELTIDLGKDKATSAILYNSKGMVVKEEILNTEKTTVDTSKLQTGVYFVHLLDENGAVILREKIIKN
ncbi:T9SS type A sorting domain-containing protein [uncultured Kordia sp.]|uniref:T9SS type A sorting domain-containing protein n=1 Tax=uncultured Kordia sp. TaxID=507699 RepID=UPI00261A750A|nr:T9SS type A sorting domain-containing protein [uncultured Kordia sp.]